MSQHYHFKANSAVVVDAISSHPNAIHQQILLVPAFEKSTPHWTPEHRIQRKSQSPQNKNPLAISALARSIPSFLSLQLQPVRYLLLFKYDFCCVTHTHTCTHSCQTRLAWKRRVHEYRVVTGFLFYFDLFSLIGLPSSKYCCLVFLLISLCDIWEYMIHTGASANEYCLVLRKNIWPICKARRAEQLASERTPRNICDISERATARPNCWAFLRHGHIRRRMY